MPKQDKSKFLFIKKIKIISRKRTSNNIKGDGTKSKELLRKFPSNKRQKYGGIPVNKRGK